MEFYIAACLFLEKTLSADDFKKLIAEINNKKQKEFAAFILDNALVEEILPSNPNKDAVKEGLTCCKTTVHSTSQYHADGVLKEELELIETKGIENANLSAMCTSYEEKWVTQIRHCICAGLKVKQNVNRRCLKRPNTHSPCHSRSKGLFAPAVM